MMKSPIDGHFIDDMLVYTDRKGELYVSRGYRLEAPDLENSEIAGLNTLEDEIRVLLRNLKPGTRYQFRWDSDSDYRAFLLNYRRATEASNMSDWAETARNERFVRYFRGMEEGKLRRERLHLFVTTPVSGRPGRTRSRRQFYESALKSAETSFRPHEQVFNQVCSRLGGQVQPLDDLGHFRECLRFFNPAVRLGKDTEAGFDLLQSICEQCLKGDARFGDQAFYLDGLWHEMLVLKDLPQATYSGMIGHLTALEMLGYSITINVQALEIGKEIEREEAKLGKLVHALAHSQRQRLTSAIEKKRRKIQRLMSNDVTPFKMQLIVRAWDTTQEGLQAKLASLKAAMLKMQSASCYEPAFPATFRNYLFASMPGWSWGHYQDHTLYIDDHNLANLLPISGTPTGKLEDAEAVYDGRNGNLVGIKTFDGGPDNQSPEHGVVIAKSNAGKSTMVIDLLTQTEPFYDLTVLIDDGLSYEPYVQACVPGTRSIVLKPDGDVTFNYLDPCQLPFSATHLADASALVHLMAGVCQDEDKNRLRAASITTALRGLYQDHVEQWSRDHRARYLAIARQAMAMGRWNRQQAVRVADPVAKHLSFQAWQTEHPEACARLMAKITDADAERFARDPDTAEQVFQLSFTEMSAEELPTHAQLQEWLTLESMGNHPRKEEFSILATLLEPWCAESGSYGALLDGPTNVDLSGKVIHFELGQIPESAKDIRAIAAFLITNQIRNEIMRRPRNLRKRVVLEELGAFVNMPGGTRIAKEFYERMRKYNCWVLSIFQQSTMLDIEALKSSVLGNAKMALLLKQTDQTELDRLGKHFALPEATKEAIKNFPDPSKDSPAGFCYVARSESKPIIALGQNVLSETMLDVASSNGEHFEKRKARQALAHESETMEDLSI